MSRLTKGYEKHNNEFISYVADSSLYPEMMGYEYEQADMDCINKLGKLEDLEEELGIDLLTLFKALKDGFEVGNDKMRVSVKGCKLVYREEDNDYVFIYDYYLIKLKDYGKYWWLEKPKEQDND